MVHIQTFTADTKGNPRQSWNPNKIKIDNFVVFERIPDKFCFHSVILSLSFGEQENK